MSGPFGCHYMISEALFSQLLQVANNINCELTSDFIVVADYSKSGMLSVMKMEDWQKCDKRLKAEEYTIGRERYHLASISWITYGRIIIELFRQKSDFWPRLFGPMINQMYMRSLAQMPASVCDRMVDWFTYHLTNFEYQWPWAAWAKPISEPSAAATSSGGSTDTASGMSKLYSDINIDVYFVFHSVCFFGLLSN